MYRYLNVSFPSFFLFEEIAFEKPKKKPTTDNNRRVFTVQHSTLDWHFTTLAQETVSFSIEFQTGFLCLPSDQCGCMWWCCTGRFYEMKNVNIIRQTESEMSKEEAVNWFLIVCTTAEFEKQSRQAFVFIIEMRFNSSCQQLGEGKCCLTAT